MQMMNILVNQRLDFERLAKLAEKPPLFEPSPERLWDDPYIAQQMLKAHLNPNIDSASRKPDKITDTVAWICKTAELTAGKRLLDLGCGPGLYAKQFAERGLVVTGVDISENSLRYAREHDPASTYIQLNYLDLNESEAYDTAVLIYGDICTLTDTQRDQVLQNVYRALRPGGYFIFDVMTTTQLSLQRRRNEWTLETGAGFWKPAPHLVLYRTWEYDGYDIGLDQYLVLEDNGSVSEYRIWSHYYTQQTICKVLEAQGFTVLSNENDEFGTPYRVSIKWLWVVARKPQP
jgi:SAM-dependent methyltransferase